MPRSGRTACSGRWRPSAGTESRWGSGGGSGGPGGVRGVTAGLRGAGLRSAAVAELRLFAPKIWAVPLGAPSGLRGAVPGCAPGCAASSGGWGSRRGRQGGGEPAVLCGHRGVRGAGTERRAETGGAVRWAGVGRERPVRSSAPVLGSWRGGGAEFCGAAPVTVRNGAGAAFGADGGAERPGHSQPRAGFPCSHIRNSAVLAALSWRRALLAPGCRSAVV